MLKQIVLGLLGAVLFSDVAFAQSCSAFSYTLMNTTTANADQVMSDLNTVRNCVNTLQSGGTIGTPTITTSATVPLVIGGTGTTSALSLRSTSGVGATGADIKFQTGNSGATEAMRILNNGLIGIGTASPTDDLDIQKSSTGNVVARVYNTSTGAAAAARFDLATGLANAYSTYQLLNNSGNTYLQLALGSGVTAGFYLDSPYFVFRKTDGTERVRIDTGTGNVGIGTTSPAQALQVVGNIRVGPSANLGCVENFSGTLLTGTCSSDERLKTVTGNVTGVLDKVSSLNLVNFKWNRTAERVYHNSTTTPNTGFIAQSVQKVFPELVSTDANGYEQLNYTTLELYGLEAIKELKAANDNQAAKIVTLQRQVSELQHKAGVQTAAGDNLFQRAASAIGWK